MNFGVIVVGAGHAGIEASLAAARMGVPTLMEPESSSASSTHARGQPCERAAPRPTRPLIVRG